MGENRIVFHETDLISDLGKRLCHFRFILAITGKKAGKGAQWAGSGKRLAIREM